MNIIGLIIAFIVIIGCSFELMKKFTLQIFIIMIVTIFITIFFIYLLICIFVLYQKFKLENLLKCGNLHVIMNNFEISEYDKYP